MTAVDLDYLRGLYEVHNEVGAEFAEILGRDYLAANAVFVEFAEAPGGGTHHGREAITELFRRRFETGSMRVEDLELSALDDRRALASFRICMHGARSEVDTSMRLWNLITLESGRITRIEEFTRKDAALAAADG